jgi:class 3 adenylate cyclase
VTREVLAKTDGQRIVVVFDICSSTKILEDLTSSENLHQWANLLIDIKEFLLQEQRKLGFEIYKFIGDGWILLFDLNLPKSHFIPFLLNLSDEYKVAFKKRVRNLLTTRIQNVGVTFGVDKSTLIPFVMNEQTEYTGRAMNVASRLQGAIKLGDTEPQGKVLMSKPVYEYLRPNISKDYRVVGVDRELNNVAGGNEYCAIKLYLYEKSSRLPSTKAQLSAKPVL